ncbi:MAG TPA: S41 family peptidase [Candidatus Marinimicrobia bacterium]|jgi:carboxyl-terminal processing protease|nr:S41 family peptidase [Candidatus Neomarinimicrobiota bacterium]HIL86409.1 S41 family peptidase [Candidatus Neomarinimicrobiota bacterium]
MRYLKKASIIFMVLVVCFFGILRSQQLDVYRDIARSQQQIMTVYKYLLTEYVHELDVPKLTSRIIKSMLENFDPYTEYYEEKDLEDLAIKTDGKFSGVGLQIYIYEDQLTVVGPIEGSPASRAGIFTGDEIMNIDGKSTKGLELKEATNKIRGDKGTNVILTIKKPITGETEDYTITRDTITIKDIPYYGMANPEVGYLRITNFSNNTPGETRDALLSLMGEGADNIIIDLRDNPGGLLSSSLDILDLILPKDVEMVSTKGRKGRSLKNYKSLNSSFIPNSIDIAVLINGGSASASEIVAGVLQDHDRAVVLGDQSFGKGLVQTVIGINQDTALKITNSKYYIPSGRSIQKRKFIDEELIADNSLVADSLYQTMAGRTVLGGGGISPDVIVKDEGSYPLAASILRNGGFFRFVQQSSDQYTTIDDVIADNSLMKNFKTFINDSDIKGYVDGQKDLETAKEKLSKEDKDNIFLKNAFSVIERQIDKNQSEMFEIENDVIKRMILGEFAFYYDGNDGKYELYLKDDKVVIKALEVLMDDSIYSSLLTVPEPNQVAAIKS